MFFSALAFTAFTAFTAATDSLDRAAEALVEFRVDEALQLLERAKSEGPYRYADHVRLYEQLGIAFAYAGKKEQSAAAFDQMLAIDPAHALSYSLSPKVTLVFERARQHAAERAAPQIDLALPRGKAVHEALPIDVDVLSDPMHFLFKAKIIYRADNEAWRTIEVRLEDPSGRHHVALPPLAPRERAAVVELYTILEDRAGNEVMLVGSEREPREIALSYTTPEPWFERWWVWTIAGVVIAGGTAAAVVAATDNSEPTISGRAFR